MNKRDFMRNPEKYWCMFRKTHTNIGYYITNNTLQILTLKIPKLNLYLTLNNKYYKIDYITNEMDCYILYEINNIVGYDNFILTKESHETNDNVLINDDVCYMGPINNNGGSGGVPTDIISPDNSLVVGGSGYSRTIITKEPLDGSSISKINGNYDLKVDNVSIKKRLDGSIYALTEGGGIPEAPDDGKQYGRQSQTWTEILNSGGGGLEEIEVYSFNGLLNSTIGGTTSVSTTQLTLATPGLADFQIGSLIYSSDGTIAFIKSLVTGMGETYVNAITISKSPLGGAELEVYFSDDALFGAPNQSIFIDFNRLHLKTSGTELYTVGSTVYDGVGSIGYLQSKDSTRALITTTSLTGGGSANDDINEVYQSHTPLNVNINAETVVSDVDLTLRTGLTTKYSKSSIVYDDIGTIGYISDYNSSESKSTITTTSKVGQNTTNNTNTLYFRSEGLVNDISYLQFFDKNTLTLIAGDNNYSKGSQIFDINGTIAIIINSAGQTIQAVTITKVGAGTGGYEPDNKSIILSDDKLAVQLSQQTGNNLNILGDGLYATGGGSSQPTTINTNSLVVTEIDSNPFNLQLDIKDQPIANSISLNGGFFDTKIDNSTISKDENGVLHAIGSISGITEASYHLATVQAISEVFK